MDITVDAGDVRVWVPLVTTVILAGITAWMAWLTKRLADSSTDAANSARLAAEASRAAAVIAESALPVRFSINPVYAWGAPLDECDDSDVGEDVLGGVRLECAGATVFVHRVTLVGAVRQLHPDEHEWEELDIPLHAYDAAIAEPRNRVPSPTRMHAGETLFFLTDGWLEEWPSDGLSGVDVMVHYSPVGDGEGKPIRLKWGPH